MSKSKENGPHGQAGGKDKDKDEDEDVLPPLPEDALLIIPVRDMVLYPGITIPVVIGRAPSLAAAREAARSERPVGILLQRDEEIAEPVPADLHTVGTVAVILRHLAAPNGVHHLICQGQQRFRVLEFLPGYPFLAVRTEPVLENQTITPEIEARAHTLKEEALEGLRLLPQTPAELLAAIESITQPSLLADVVASTMEVPASEKQEMLEVFDLQERLDLVIRKLGHQLAVLRLSKEISRQTQQSVGENQREYLLREQLKTIQKELGETDAKAEDLRELALAIAKAGMPEEVAKQAAKELKRLERMPEGAGEYAMVRTYLDWLIELPWSVASPLTSDIGAARRILDQDHYGLEKVKRRILEFLAVRKLRPEGKGAILCFVGPPGVGKTSLGQSIARATGRKFARLSLGGIHDEAEIRGHRRTYIGALPGNILQSLHKAGSRNCVLMLDELDKLGTGFHGDPSAALLEVLDPEQNVAFRDNYLGVPFNLSEVMFIGTANLLDNVPGPLRDRMEVIELPGYTEEEKLEIAQRYLLARQTDANGLTAEQAGITGPGLVAIIRDYTREAGCRNLEREIGSVFRHVAMEVAEGTAPARTVVDAGDLRPILGPVRFESELAQRTSVPGVATGLAWTATGGDILFIEAARMPGKDKLILTGQLGDVMKESAQAALSLVKAHAGTFGLTDALFENCDIHIHVPAGATPKDGPSAGIAMVVALVSLLSGRTCRSDLAMTGEISLRGLVLPVGGIKEKTVAAARAGLTEVMLPARNRREFEEIPETARKHLTFHWIDRAEQAVALALGDSPKTPA